MNTIVDSNFGQNYETKCLCLMTLKLDFPRIVFFIESQPRMFSFEDDR